MWTMILGPGSLQTLCNCTCAALVCVVYIFLAQSQVNSQTHAERRIADLHTVCNTSM